MNVEKLEVNPKAENLAAALGFSDKEAEEYLIRVLKPIWKNSGINIAECFGNIYNNEKEPFGLRIFGLYSLGVMIAERQFK